MEKEKNAGGNDGSVEFLCRNPFGRCILETMLALRVPKLLGAFLRSPLSHSYIKPFIAKNGIDMSDFSDYAEVNPSGTKRFRSFNDFFTRKKPESALSFDAEPSHLISPCDSLLSACKIGSDSVFRVKGFDYALSDFFGTHDFDGKFLGGDCLIFRLCATDYHRFCYIDGGVHNAGAGANHFIPGKLYSVQPVACENFRVYARNRRSWTVFSTDHFGDVAQIEVGAFSVGGIVHHKGKNLPERFERGEEKGYFDLHGSTIVMLFEKGKIELLPEIASAVSGGSEFRVKYGQQIGTKPTAG